MVKMQPIYIYRFNTLLSKLLLCDYKVPGSLPWATEVPCGGVSRPPMPQKQDSIDFRRLDLRAKLKAWRSITAVQGQGDVQLMTRIPNSGVTCTELGNWEIKDAGLLALSNVGRQKEGLKLTSKSLAWVTRWLMIPAMTKNPGKGTGLEVRPLIYCVTSYFARMTRGVSGVCTVIHWC